MMPGNLFRLELLSAFAGRRRMVLRVGITILLGLPFVVVEMPPSAKTAGMMMVILFTSFLGSAIGHARLRADQRFERLVLLPISKPFLWLDLVLASVLIRLLPTATILTLFLLVHARNASAGDITGLYGLLCASLVLLTLLGIATGKMSRNNQEVHLYGALAVVVLAVICGVTPHPERLSGIVGALAWNPMARLKVVLTHVANGSASENPVDLIFAILVLVGVIAIAVLRWIAGGKLLKVRERKD